MILLTILSLKTYYKLKIYTHSDTIIDKFSLDLEVQARLGNTQRDLIFWGSPDCKLSSWYVFSWCPTLDQHPPPLFFTKILSPELDSTNLDMEIISWVWFVQPDAWAEFCLETLQRPSNQRLLCPTQPGSEFKPSVKVNMKVNKNMDKNSFFLYCVLFWYHV